MGTLPFYSLAISLLWKQRPHRSYLVTAVQKNGHMEHPTKARVLMRFLFSLFLDSLYPWKVLRNHGSCFTEVTFFLSYLHLPIKGAGSPGKFNILHTNNEFLQIYRKIGPQKEGGGNKPYSFTAICIIPVGWGFKLSLWRSPPAGCRFTLVLA